MLAQAATATTGVVDTVAMAMSGSKVSLAAVAIASVFFSFVYWGFGFLRMTTTALTAQALGREDTLESHAVLQRALYTGAGLGVCIVIISPILLHGVSWFYPVEADVLDEIAAYFWARIWGAPALLTSYGIMGWLLGTGRTRQLLLFQVVANTANGGLDAYFVGRLELGAGGIGAGTAISEWVSLAFGLFLVRDALRYEGTVWVPERLAELWSANRDVMIRTLALLFAFGWFVRSGTSLSTATAAGNEVLLQFITVAAFILDGFAFIAEKEAGEAFGAASSLRLRRAIRVTSQLALASGLGISVMYYAGGDTLIRIVVTDGEAREVARTFLPWCAAVPLIGVFAYQLDGIFLGTTQGRSMRNASVMSCALYVATDVLLGTAYGNAGIWTAFLLLYVYRAICLGYYLPSLFRAVELQTGSR